MFAGNLEKNAIHRRAEIENVAVSPAIRSLAASEEVVADRPKRLKIPPQ